MIVMALLMLGAAALLGLDGLTGWAAATTVMQQILGMLEVSGAIVAVGIGFVIIALHEVCDRLKFNFEQRHRQLASIQSELEKANQWSERLDAALVERDAASK